MNDYITTLTYRNMHIQTTLYSIGHGQKPLEEFYEELISFGIQYIIDVRSSPFSKWAPQYNQREIAHFLRSNDLVYAYMGNTIGGRPINDYCYDSEGHFDYEKMAQEPSFKEGLLRLVKANEQQLNVAVMCSESDPTQCHRSKLIGRELSYQHEAYCSAWRVYRRGSCDNGTYQRAMDSTRYEPIPLSHALFQIKESI